MGVGRILVARGITAEHFPLSAETGVSEGGEVGGWGRLLYHLLCLP